MLRVAILGLAACVALGAQAAERLPDRRAVGVPVITTSTTHPTQPVSPSTGPVGAGGQSAVLELLKELEALRAQTMQLQNQVELQGHELEKLRSRQRDLIGDLDRRLRELEGRGQAAAPAPVAPPPRAVVSGDEQQSYDSAFALLKQGRYEQAIQAFRDFLGRYPQTPLADNAQYWVAQANYVLRNQKLALEEFGRLVSAYPHSDKVPDALLKMGILHAELGNKDEARRLYTDLVNRYPRADAALNAKKRLEIVDREAP